MAELATLLTSEIPEGMNNLADSHTNLERVAEYCEGNYFQSENKRAALEETKNYTTQSLASVAYQINTLAYNFLQLLDLQTAQLGEMESQMNHIAQTVMIHKEKVARREIGVLTATKNTNRQYKIIAPANPEKPIKYTRKPIDFNLLDEVGHGVRSSSGGYGAGGGGMRTLKQRGNSQGSIQSLQQGGIMSVGGPAPTTKPPTPPQPIRPGGTLNKGSRDYRTPPAVAPPQVPSHYAPNYPMGHPRRGRDPGYSTLPMNMSGSHTLPHSHHTTAPPQAMVHPMVATMNTDQHEQQHHTLGHRISSSHQQQQQLQQQLQQQMAHAAQQAMAARGSLPGNVSPPLPPPPPPAEGVSSIAGGDDDDGDQHHLHFGQPPPANASMGSVSGSNGIPGIVPDDHHLPGWVPKNYIEKVVAIYDYYADKEDELSFQESAVIYVLKKNDDGWWEGVMEGITGLFPGNYVEPCV